MLTEKFVSVLLSIFTKRKTLEKMMFCVYIIDSEMFLICISREISF